MFNMRVAGYAKVNKIRCPWLKKGIDQGCGPE
jgi:hypothetical protein